MSVMTEREPTEDEWRDLLFAWRVCKHVRSNAIVIAKDGATTGIGAGQMSRVDSVRLAIEKSGLDSLEGRRSPRMRTSPSPTVRSWRSRPASGR